MNQYIIIEGQTTQMLETYVNAQMKKAYRPIGAPFFANGYFYQAMSTVLGN